jgi:hypothetical protein
MRDRGEGADGERSTGHGGEGDTSVGVHACEDATLCCTAEWAAEVGGGLIRLLSTPASG